MFLWYDNLYAYAGPLVGTATPTCRACRCPATRRFTFCWPSGLPGERLPEHYCDDHAPLNRAPASDDGWDDEWKGRFCVASAAA